MSRLRLMPPKRLAMHGPMFSGKSTVSGILDATCGFLYANYTDYGKVLCARALSAMLGREVPVAEVRSRKNEPRMRDFLIAALRVYGFDEGAGVDTLLKQLDISPAMDVVFDNVRYLPQYEKLRDHGFRLVRLFISDEEQERRAALAGMPVEKLRALRQESSETSLPYQDGEIRITVDGKLPDEVVSEILDDAALFA